MLPDSTVRAFIRADKKSGTCSSVSLVLRRASHQTARPATFIATLRCKTVSEQVCHRLADAPRSIGPRRKAPALIRKSGQETVTGQAGHRLLLVSHPQPLKGSIITRETECQRHRQCPESAKINIIPSVLWNSRQHPHYHAFTESTVVRKKPAPATSQASDSTIRIMLTVLRRCGAKVFPSNSRVRRRRTSGPLQGLPASKPVRGPRTLRILRGNVSASSSSAPPAVGTAACDFRFDARIRG